MALFFGALAHNIEGASTDFTLYVANYLNYGGAINTRYYAIEEFDSFGQASAFVTNVSFTSPVLSAPIGVALDASNNVYVTCSQDSTWIEKFDPWGNNAVQFTSLGGAQGNGMTFDAAGNLYLAYGRFGGVYVYSPSGTQSIFTNGLGIVDLVDLVFDSARNLYVSDEQNGVILRFDPQTNMTTFASPGNAPYGLAFDAAGDLYAVLHGNGQIVKYTAGAGGVLNPNGAVFASLGSSTQPVGLVFDPAGFLYVSEYSANQIVRIDTNGNAGVFATAAQGLNGPNFMVIGPRAFSVDRYVVAGGGGTSSGGGWTVTGTAGQALTTNATGQLMSGEWIGVEGGFFSGPVTNFPTSTNLLVNGTFSFGSFTNNKGPDDTMVLYPGNTNMLGWTVTGSAGLDLGWIASNNDLGLSAPSAAAAGYFLDLTGYHDSVPYDGVSQTVPTIPGQTYYVSFEIGYSAQYDSAGLPAIGVTVSGAAGTIMSNNFVASRTAPWQLFQFAFMASSSSTTLAFTGTTPVNVHYIGLANVIMWSAASQPIVMSGPSVENGQLQLPFRRGGPGTTFDLQQASDPGGPWTTAQGTTMTTSADGTMGTFMIPIGRITQFYRVHSH